MNMINAEDFYLSFLSLHTREIPEEEYRKAEILINAMKAVSRITCQSSYVIDYYKKDFPYVSDNSLFLCGHTAEEVRELGYRFYQNRVAESDQAMLTEIYKAGFDFYKRLPAAEKLQHVMSYDFYLRDRHGEIHVNHRFTPMLLTGDGAVWLALCVVTPSSRADSRNLTMYKAGSPYYRKYSFDSHRWEEKERVILSEKEKNIMLLAAQGYTMDKAAEALHISLHTVKYYKREIFKKLNVTSMMEAVLFAENYKLF